MPTDAPIEWDVVLWLARADGRLPGRDRDDEIAAIASESGATGWDTEELDAAWADVPKTNRVTGWASSHRPAYRMRFRTVASTAERAIDVTKRQLTSTPGWSLQWESRPHSSSV